MVFVTYAAGGYCAMQMQEFELLSQKEQLDILYKEGIYVGKQKQNNSTFLVLQVDSFYVEIDYRKYRHHINAINCFATTSQLDPYLKEIKIDLMNK